MNPSFEEMYQECVQHYIDRGNTREQAMAYLSPATEEKILWVYECIQKEKLIPPDVATIVSWI